MDTPDMFWRATAGVGVFLGPASHLPADTDDRQGRGDNFDRWARAPEPASARGSRQFALERRDQTTG